MNIIRKTTDIGGSAFDRFDFCISKERVDRYGDLVVVKGIKHPPRLMGLWNYKADDPIGVWKGPHVVGDELRARLEFAPEGISSKIDELRKLVSCGVLNSCLIGFMPLEQEPIITNGRQTGIKFLRSELVEVSLVSCPANVDAVSLARSMKISDTTMREAFKQTTFGEQIRQARRRVALAKSRLANAKTDRERSIHARVLAIFQESERKLVARAAQPVTPLEELEAKANVLSNEMRQIEAEIQRAQDPFGVNARAQETIDAFTRTGKQIATRHPNPKPYVPSANADTTTWRGKKIDQRPTWKGKKV